MCLILYKKKSYFEYLIGYCEIQWELIVFNVCLCLDHINFCVPVTLFQGYI